MITFLPYQNFRACAECLDRQRLGKQRVEAWTLLKQLVDGSGQWLNHPAAKMWKGYEWNLTDYAGDMCVVWMERGYEDNLLDKIMEVGKLTTFNGYPGWLGDHRLHDSHRAQLVHKFPEHYKPIFGDLPYQDYYWPVK